MKQSQLFIAGVLMNPSCLGVSLPASWEGLKIAQNFEPFEKSLKNLHRGTISLDEMNQPSQQSSQRCQTILNILNN